MTGSSLMRCLLRREFFCLWITSEIQLQWQTAVFDKLMQLIVFLEQTFVCFFRYLQLEIRLYVQCWIVSC